MDRDHKYSGTLPLLAYAPQDFGLNAQRSRAYRARAAMGRTGVKPLRNHVQAPVIAPKTAIAVKTLAVEMQPEQTSSLFAKLWLRAARIFSKSNNTEATSETSLPTADAARKTVAVAVQESSASSPRFPSRKMVEEPVIAEPAIRMREVEEDRAAVKEPPVEDIKVSEPYLPVSKTYASMRMSNVGAVSEQTIPQAPDLAHALAEIRQALREHEKLANAKLNSNL